MAKDGILKILADEIPLEKAKKIRDEWAKIFHLPKGFVIDHRFAFDYGALEEKVLASLPKELPEDKLVKVYTWTFILGRDYKTGVQNSKPISVPSEMEYNQFPPRPWPPVSLSSVQFDAQQDLPNPGPGDTYQGPDGSLWYAVDNNTWAEYTDLYGICTPTGRVIDVRNRAVRLDTSSINKVHISTAKSRVCDNPWDHKWKKYEGLLEVFDYCEHCDEKRK